MRTPLILLLLITLLPWSVTTAAAFDPRTIDIVGLRLGMSRQEVLTSLGAQGADPGRIYEQRGPCATQPKTACTVLVKAPTHDGALLLRFVARAGPGTETVWSIAYTLAGRGAGEPEMIRNAVQEHFGPPTSRDPMMWCATTGTDGCDPADQPQLVYTEGPDTSSTLTLSDPAAVRSSP